MTCHDFCRHFGTCFPPENLPGVVLTSMHSVVRILLSAWHRIAIPNVSSQTNWEEMLANYEKKLTKRLQGHFFLFLFFVLHVVMLFGCKMVGTLQDTV